jgi:hypothetical protein
VDGRNKITKETNSVQQGFGSGYGLDPYSIRTGDPDLDPYSESGSGSRRAKITHKKLGNFMF